MATLLVMMAAACGLAALAMAEPKWGAGALDAMRRLGVEELRNAVSLGKDSVEAPTPYGAIATKTPGEVAQERQKDAAHDQEAEQGSHGKEQERGGHGR